MPEDDLRVLAPVFDRRVRFSGMANAALSVPARGGIIGAEIVEANICVTLWRV
jgi:hypothetical protein